MGKIIIFIGFLIGATTALSEDTFTQAKAISQIELKQWGGELTYFNLYSETGSWDAKDSACSQAGIVSFHSTTTIGYEQFLSMALAAKLSGRNVSFKGECVDANVIKGMNIKIW
jgi:hypothetical protein